MTENAKEAWGTVGEKFTSWGRRVSDRYHETGSPEGADPEAAEWEFKRATKDLMDELSRGFTALGETLRDDDAKKELKAAVDALGDAITATVDETTTAMRKGGGSDREPPPAP